MRPTPVPPLLLVIAGTFVVVPSVMGIDPPAFVVGDNNPVTHPVFFEPERCPVWEQGCQDSELQCERPEVYVGQCLNNLPPDIDPQHPEDWPGIAQNEPFIAASPRGAPVSFLLSGWNDYTLAYSGGEVVVGFATSVDGGTNWSRCAGCCGLGGFLEGHSLIRTAFANCPPPGHTLLKQGDVGVAIDGQGTAHMVALGRNGDPLPVGCGHGLDPVEGVLYARSYDQGATWDTTMIPGSENGQVSGAGPGCKSDKELIAADRRPGFEAVYAGWTRIVEPSSGVLDLYTEIVFAGSPNGGDEFFGPNDLAVVISQRPNDCSFYLPPMQCDFGAMPAVGSQGEVHLIWNDFGSGLPAERIDAVHLRSTWDQGQTFVPPLGTDEAEVLQYNPVSRGGAVKDMINLDNLYFPQVAADATQDPCGWGGKAYIAFNHEEYTTLDTADSNIYVVRTLSVDPVTKDITWTGPVLVNGDPESPVVCPAPPPGTPAIRYPLQFMPAIAVDDDGRVGVMWYDTRNDPDPCDENIVFDVYLSYSLDGGQTFQPEIRVTDVSSQSVPDPLEPVFTVSLREYVAVAARENEFHLAWTDVRNWNGKLGDQVVEGDIFTAQVTVNEVPFSMGDCDQDGDVDSADYQEFLDCLGGGTPLGCTCETFDFDMDGDVDDCDQCLIFDCWSGRSPAYCGPNPSECGPTSGQGGGGSQSSTEPFVEWAFETLTVEQRSQIAGVLNDLAVSEADPTVADSMLATAAGLDAGP